MMKDADIYKKRMTFFTDRMNKLSAKTKQIKKTAKKVSLARIVLFTLMAVSIISGLNHEISLKNIYLITGFFSGCLFCALIFIHHSLFESIKRLELLCEINRDSISRMERHWDKLVHPEVPDKYKSHPFSSDLDIISQDQRSASLLKCLGPVHTDPGLKILMQWLYETSDNNDILLRQEAVTELQEQVTWRQDLDLNGRLLPSPTPDINPFLNWAEDSPLLLKKKHIRILILLFSAAPTLAGIANLMGIIPPYWILAFIINLIICAIAGNKCHHRFDQISASGKVFKHYARIITSITRSTYTSVMLKHLQNTLTRQNSSADKQINRFDQWVTLADVRYSSILYPILMGAFLWPFPVLIGFELWQKRSGNHVRKWFETMGTIESLSSLAALKFENPGWVFPGIEKHHHKVEAKGLGHPLLHPDSCVENSIMIGPENTFQMVTGSNMSGKSTMLRSIGLNIILAQAGGPVYAKTMILPEITLCTSFRIQDSLESGVSFFMAELKRLKEIVDQASQLNGRSSGKVLFLLDEILQGTNSVERQTAVRFIISKLIRLKSIGVISTHDLSLAESEDLKKICDLHHFTEYYKKTESGDVMKFDYKLKPGLAPTVNALKLLEIIGLLDNENTE